MSKIEYDIHLLCEVPRRNFLFYSPPVPWYIDVVPPWAIEVGLILAYIGTGAMAIFFWALTFALMVRPDLGSHIIEYIR